MLTAKKIGKKHSSINAKAGKQPTFTWYANFARQQKRRFVTQTALTTRNADLQLQKLQSKLQQYCDCSNTIPTIATDQQVPQYVPHSKLVQKYLASAEQQRLYRLSTAPTAKESKQLSTYYVSGLVSKCHQNQRQHLLKDWHAIPGRDFSINQQPQHNTQTKREQRKFQLALQDLKHHLQQLAAVGAVEKSTDHTLNCSSLEVHCGTPHASSAESTTMPLSEYTTTFAKRMSRQDLTHKADSVGSKSAGKMRSTTIFTRQKTLGDFLFAQPPASMHPAHKRFVKNLLPIVPSPDSSMQVQCGSQCTEIKTHSASAKDLNASQDIFEQTRFVRLFELLQQINVKNQQTKSEQQLSDTAFMRQLLTIDSDTKTTKTCQGQSTTLPSKVHNKKFIVRQRRRLKQKKSNKCDMRNYVIKPIDCIAMRQDFRPYQLADATGQSILRAAKYQPDLLPNEQIILPIDVNKMTAQPLLPLHVAWLNLVCANTLLHASIILQQTVNLQQIHAFLKSLGYCYAVNDLRRFFTKRCIAFQ